MTMLFSEDDLPKRRQKNGLKWLHTAREALGNHRNPFQSGTPDEKLADLGRKLSYIHPGLTFRISKRARHIALRMDAKQRMMYLVMPARTNIDKAYRFAYQHRDWIKQNLNSLPAPIPFEHDAEIPFCGQKIRIKISYDSSLKRTSITLKENVLSVQTNKEDPSGRITRFLKEQARQELTLLANQKATEIDKKIQQLTVRDTKSRWGSCSIDGEISLSWRLAFAPPEAMDYVVAHEVAHLAHHNHGARFWALCKRLSKNYSKGRQWIDEQGHSLMRYGFDVPQNPPPKTGHNQYELL